MDDQGLYHSSLKDEIIWESVEKSRDELRVVHGPFLDYFFLIFGLFFLYFLDYYVLLCTLKNNNNNQEPNTPTKTRLLFLLPTGCISLLGVYRALKTVGGQAPHIFLLTPQALPSILPSSPTRDGSKPLGRNQGSVHTKQRVRCHRCCAQVEKCCD